MIKLISFKTILEIIGGFVLLIWMLKSKKRMILGVIILALYVFLFKIL
jgi:drug/metabolite transporter superfamily protein YnfA